MQETILNLKQKINKNYTQLTKNNVLIKPMLNSINNLIATKATDKNIHQYLNKYDNIIFNIEYNLKIIEEKNDFENKIKILILRIKKYEKELHDDYILVETTLSVLECLLSGKIPHEKIEELFNNTSSTLKVIEDKIDKIEQENETGLFKNIFK